MAKNGNGFHFLGILFDMLQGLMKGSGAVMPTAPSFPLSRRERRAAERRERASSRNFPHAKARYGQFTLEASGDDPVGMMTQIGTGVTKAYSGLKVADRAIDFVFDTAEKVRNRAMKEKTEEDNKTTGNDKSGGGYLEWTQWFKKRFHFPDLPDPFDCIVPMYPEGQRNAMLLHLISMWGALVCPRVCAKYNGSPQWPILNVVVEGEAGQGKSNFAKIYNNLFSRVIESDNQKVQAGSGGIIQNIGANTTMSKYIKYVDANKGIPLYMFEEELDTMNTNIGKQGRLSSELFRTAYDNGYINQHKDDGSPCGKFRSSFNFTATGTPEAVRRFIGGGDDNGLASRLALAKIEDRDFNFDMEGLSDEDYRVLQDEIDTMRRKYCYTTVGGVDTPCQEVQIDLGYVEAALKQWEQDQVKMADSGDKCDYLRKDWCGRMSTTAFRCAIVIAVLYGIPGQNQQKERQHVVDVALYIANYCMERSHKLFAEVHNRRRAANHQAEQMQDGGSTATTSMHASSPAKKPGRADAPQLKQEHDAGTGWEKLGQKYGCSGNWIKRLVRDYERKTSGSK